jgi:hypothetical protein
MPDEARALTITDTIISRLAREIARNLYPPAAVREQFKLSVEEFDDATNSAFFQTRLAEEISLWNDPQNARVRISAKAATLIEESMPEIYALIHDRTQPMSAKVQALQAAARWAGIEHNPAITGGGDDGDRKVKITINIDGKALSYEKEKAKIVDAEVVQLSEGAIHGEREAH